jgi:ribose-phosphate pyrophosphokinase
VTTVVLSSPGAERLAASLARQLGATVVPVLVRSFPDGESLVRIDGELPGGCDAVLACDLHHPDRKLLPLVFAADAAHELGARRVGLVCPYLPYMRQDARFHPGEAISSRSFARLLSRTVEWLVTVDPHLHRHRSLAELYSIPGHVVHAAPRIADFIREQVPRPLLVGPDEESAQWVSDVAGRVGAPFTVLSKVRSGDVEVEVSSLDDAREWRGRTPVLVDDIVSTARTLAAAVARLRAAGHAAPVCIGVHALFEGDALAALERAGAARVVTCDTVPHATNGIDLSADIAAAVRPLVSSS